MAHKTMIGGAIYSVGGGQCLVGGTSYSVAGGKTLIGGTSYDISFAPAELVSFDPAVVSDTNSFITSHLRVMYLVGTASGSTNTWMNPLNAQYSAYASISSSGIYLTAYTNTVPGVGTSSLQGTAVFEEDFTRYSTLHATVQSTHTSRQCTVGYCDIHPFSAPPLNLGGGGGLNAPLIDGVSLSNDASTFPVSTDVEITVDITSVSGVKYIRCSGGYVTFRKIWLT